MIQCFLCGECCRTLFQGMLVTGEELYLIEAKTGIKLDSTLIRPNRFALSGNCCPFLKPTSCAIYDIRPCQCRLYHCGRLSPSDKKLDSIWEIKALMDTNPEYRQFKETMDREAIAWGNAHGWSWKKVKHGDKVLLPRH